VGNNFRLPINLKVGHVCYHNKIGPNGLAVLTFFRYIQTQQEQLIETLRGQTKL